MGSDSVTCDLNDRLVSLEGHCRCLERSKVKKPHLAVLTASGELILLSSESNSVDLALMSQQLLIDLESIQVPNSTYAAQVRDAKQIWVPARPVKAC